MSSFRDKEIADVKEMLERTEGDHNIVSYSFTKEKLASLIYRLESAEDCIHGHHSNCTSQMNNERCSCGVYKWRKAAGK